jgi:NADH dehydrogenase/NADH:ubiquinone oxidoreductase subunit G
VCVLEKQVGALTSKVYAFKARSWEFKNYDSIDFVDGLGSPIRLEVRGSEIMRILPRRENRFNEEWITDKIRFISDGIKKQRLQRPFYRLWNGIIFGSSLIPTGWKGAMTYLLKYKSLGLHFDVVLGQFVDLETQILAKKFFSNYSYNFISMNNYSGMLSDFRSLYVLTCTPKDLEEADLIVFCGSNILKDYPMLYLKAAHYYITNGKLVLSFGMHVKLGYYLGNTTKSFIDFLNGKSLSSSALAYAKRPVFVIGTGFLEFFSGVFDHAFDFVKLVHKVNSNAKIGSLMTNISDVGGFDVGLYAREKMELDPTRFNILYLFGADYNLKLDGFYSLYDYDMVVYQGHHGDRLAESVDVILPGVVPFEKTASFLTILGGFVANEFVVTPVGDARVDWKILNGLLAFSGLSCYEDYNHLLSDMLIEYAFPIVGNLVDFVGYDLFYFFSAVDRNSDVRWSSIFNIGKREAYYRSDAIVRSSYLLMLMSKRSRLVRKMWR